jgi:hypothetical protein
MVLKVNFLSNNETSNPASTVALSSGVRFKFHKENTIGRDLGYISRAIRCQQFQWNFRKE